VKIVLVIFRHNGHMCTVVFELVRIEYHHYAPNPHRLCQNRLLYKVQSLTLLASHKS